MLPFLGHFERLKLLLASKFIENRMLIFLKSNFATFLTAIIQVFGQFHSINLNFGRTADAGTRSQMGIHQCLKRLHLRR